MMERLQKYMARCGVASRRKCEEFIANGEVKVNDEIVTELGFKVDPSSDKVVFRGEILKPEEEKVYIMLNKPTGYITSVKDEKGRKTVLDLVKTKERIYPIGRLDYDTSGLILLTNDGDVYNKLIHPREEIDKLYEAIIEGVPNKDQIDRFCNGVDIGGYITSNAKLVIIDKNPEKAKVHIIIHEGKNRQVRRMCDAINHPVMELKRKAIGRLEMKNLQEGQWRYLTEEEINYIKNL
ncbi:pseudouridine synthase [Haloimpatiens lingqiaonensis]|uniref:pseudouridine synthase n=1 Tax=Haloimpatiens lingqiaonensis TaxID=1380675 RepID=UPI0010FE2A65|nr:pseudouridine synthase [Haloimpatiens lingqiaonensis]